jgi:hypothetical protein
MLKVSAVLLLLILQPAIPSLGQSGSTPSLTQITGAVQSFSGNTLDIKPATTPAVWVTIPTDLRVDRNALKSGVEVSVQARWAEVCYVATQVTIQK